MHAPASIPARIVNRALAQEDGLRAKLAAHAGSAFRIACGPADASLAIDADGALHEAEADVVPALTLTMRARDVPTLLHDPSRFDALVRADGDAALAATLRDLAATMPWFVERLFGAAFGNVLGQRLADAGRRLLGFPGDAAARFGANVKSYVGEETELGVSHPAAAAFEGDVRDLAARVDALAARIDALAARRG